MGIGVTEEQLKKTLRFIATIACHKDRMMESGRSKVLMKKTGDSAFISLNNRPFNVIDVEVLQDLITVISEAEVSDEIRKVVVRSKIEGVFSVGFDTSCMLIRLKDRMEEIFNLARTVWNLITSSQKVFIAEVDGLCAGLAYELIYAFDLVVCGSRAMFGFPDIKFGMPLLTGIPWGRIPEDGISHMMSGEIVSADRLNFIRAQQKSRSDSDNRNYLYAISFYKRSRRRSNEPIDNIIPSAYDLGAIDLRGLERFREVTLAALNVPLNPS